MTVMWPRKMGGKLDGTAAIAVPAIEQYVHGIEYSVHLPVPTATHAGDFAAVRSEQLEFAVYVMRPVPFWAGDRLIEVIVQADPDLSTEEIGWRVLREALSAVMPSEADVL